MHDENKTVSLPWFGIPKLFPYIKKYRRKLIIMASLGIGVSLLESMMPLFNRYVLDHFVGLGTLDTLPAFIALYIAVILIKVAGDFTSTYLGGQVEMSVNRDLRNASFNHLQTLSFSYFNQHNVGYIHARVMSDTGRIGEMVSWGMMELIWNGAYVLCVILVMIFVNARLALYVLALLPAAVVLITLFQKKLIRLNRKIREINSTITGDFNEGITGARSIKTMVIEDTMNRDFVKDIDEMHAASVRTGRTGAMFTSMITLMSALVLAVILWRGGLLTQQRILQIGTLSVFMSYALWLIEPIQGLVQTLSGLISIQANIERFTGLMNTQSDVADTPEVIEKYGDTFAPKKENWEPLIGDIDFEDVSFVYPDGNETVLDHFSLHVPHGTNVAIVGETGAGKSTLVNLICRFFEPTEGRILIDGRDARERSQLWLHSNIGYVLQTPHLFSGTVRDNLRYGRPDATDEEIMEALKLVSADSAVEKMEKGLDSEVGEGGDMLSTGEKQLLSFARAILADPKILVLDEATSSIDTVTEKAIQDAIRKVIRGRTSFVIAHRLSTVTDADVILVVKDGVIIEQGRHRELMRQKGYYYSLYTRQFENMAADLI